MLLLKLSSQLNCWAEIRRLRLLRYHKRHIKKMSTATGTLEFKVKSDKPQKTLRKKFTSVVPGSVNLQVLGAGANGAPGAAYLFTDQSRYLFNCGEGTQRLAHEHKTKLSRLEQIFVTRNTWHTIGGLPGLTLTIQDSGVRTLGLRGPPHLHTSLQSMRRFVVLNNMQVNTVDCTENPDFEDNVLSVKAVPVYSSSPEDKKWQKIAVQYVCKLKPRRGALILEKCVEYEVPPGPLLGKLKNGLDITLENGRLVRSIDVTEPTETALCFVFIDIPTMDYLPALEKIGDTFKMLGSEVATVLHFTDHLTAANSRYKTFMQHNFGSEVQHLYLNSTENSFSGYTAAHRIQYQLNQLDPRVFPLLDESIQIQHRLNTSLSINLKKIKLANTESLTAQHEIQASIKEGVFGSMTSFHLRPKKGLDRTLEAVVTPDEYIRETNALEGFQKSLETLREKQREEFFVSTPVYPKITFLGTGSCIPNKTRNVSSILVQTNASAYIILDCGEGTYGQILRFFGKEKTQEVMRNLRVVYVSHLHADHHIGLIGLLNERQRLQPEDKLLLLAPRQIEPWLEFYNQRIEPISDAYSLIPNGELLVQPFTFTDSGSAFGIAAISTCLVRHCPNSFGVCVTLHEMHEEKPIKLTYSGDTMPCSDLVVLGRDSTILIHEATMEDELIDEAVAKTHSTISQAIEQGREMQATYTILTHFSQRYAKCPRLPNMSEPNGDGAAAMKNISIAFDNMQVTLADLERFHLLYPSLYAMFAEYAEDLEQRALKRELKQERKRKLVKDA